MITPEQKKRLTELPKTPYGIALQAFLDDKYKEIGNILESKSWEETLGRKFALQLLKDLFAIMGSDPGGASPKKNEYE